MKYQVFRMFVMVDPDGQKLLPAGLLQICERFGPLQFPPLRAGNFLARSKKFQIYATNVNISLRKIKQSQRASPDLNTLQAAPLAANFIQREIGLQKILKAHIPIPPLR
jgi:hypothetical protein